MKEFFLDLLQTVEKLPVVSMRIAHKDGNWKMNFVTRNIKKFGYLPDELTTGKLPWQTLFPADELEAFLGSFQSRPTAHDDPCRLQSWVISSAGHKTPVGIYVNSVHDANGKLCFLDLMIFPRGAEDDNSGSVGREVRHQMALNDILFSLHGSYDQVDPLELVLSKAGAYLGVSRVILLGEQDVKNECRVTHEWLAEGIASSSMPANGPLCCNGNDAVRASVDKHGVYVVSSAFVPQNISGELAARGILSAVIASVHNAKNNRACLRFEDLETPRDWDDPTLAFIKNIASLISSVLKQKKPDEAHLFSHQTCKAVLDNLDSLIFVTAPESDEILFANQAFRNTFGDTCVGRTYKEFLVLGSEQESEISHSGSSASGSLTGYETYLDQTGQWLAVTRDLVPWVDGDTAYLNNCYDITFKKNYEESIKRLAYLDHLTGLPNRYRCDTDLRLLTGKVKRHDANGYLLFIDLDDFKVVNDSYGHHYGDGVLVSFAAFLQECCDESNYVYRFGGDEFVLVLMNCERAEVMAKLNELLDRAKRTWKALNREFYCSLSIGVVEINPENSDPKTILQQADIAMYHAKSRNKNSYIFYTEGLDCETIKRSEMEWLLRDAMENDFQGFEIYYQPYMRTDKLEILGVEALVRMRDQDGKLLLPRSFVPLAEYLGLIVPLGEHVLRNAAAQCKAINDSGRPDFSMTVNLSARQFRQKDIVERLEGILRASGVNFSNIIISVNEGVAIKELERMLKICAQFREQGIRIALDDFGSGHSSFINMRSLPVDIVKVSSSYIDDYTDEYSGYFIRLVAELGHFSDKLVCMNGVEKEEHYEFCKKLGLDMVQGFLLQRPDSMGTIKAILERAD